MNSPQPTIDELESQERDLVLSSFDHDDAWRLGSAIRERAATAGYAVAIDIRRPSGAVLFHAALPGATADQEDWIRRKAALVFHLETSSALASARMAALGVPAGSAAWLDPARFALAGGSFPIRVRGAGIVAAATVSGLASEADHALVVDALRDLAHAAEDVPRS